MNLSGDTYSTLLFFICIGAFVAVMFIIDDRLELLDNDITELRDHVNTEMVTINNNFRTMEATDGKYDRSFKNIYETLKQFCDAHDECTWTENKSTVPKEPEEKLGTVIYE